MNILERLKQYDKPNEAWMNHRGVSSDIWEAIAEIERLRAALSDVIGDAHAHPEQEGCWFVSSDVIENAEKALGVNEQ